MKSGVTWISGSTKAAMRPNPRWEAPPPSPMDVMSMLVSAATAEPDLSGSSHATLADAEVAALMGGSDFGERSRRLTPLERGLWTFHWSEALTIRTLWPTVAEEEQGEEAPGGVVHSAGTPPGSPPGAPPENIFHRPVAVREPQASTRVPCCHFALPCAVPIWIFHINENGVRKHDSTALRTGER